MADWHIDPACDAALVRLNDSLCSFERSTGRSYVLLLVPANPDEEIHLSQDGKPLRPETQVSPQEMLDLALQQRAANPRT